MAYKGYDFVVVGRGHVPIDMLRYDQCWPRTESDASLIASTFEVRNRAEHRVQLVGLREPTVARWESFGWKVVLGS